MGKRLCLSWCLQQQSADAYHKNNTTKIIGSGCQKIESFTDKWPGQNYIRGTKGLLRFFWEKTKICLLVVEWCFSGSCVCLLCDWGDCVGKGVGVVLFLLCYAKFPRNIVQHRFYENFSGDSKGVVQNYTDVDREDIAAGIWMLESKLRNMKCTISVNYLKFTAAKCSLSPVFRYNQAVSRRLSCSAIWKWASGTLFSYYHRRSTPEN